MVSRDLPLFCIAALGAVMVAGGVASAQLANTSPFQPAGAASGSAPTAGAPLEYRGYLEAGGGRQFRIHDPARKAGTWVKLNEPNTEFGVTAKKYDSDERTLTVEYQGKTVTLAERQAKVVSSGAAAQAAPPPVASTVPTAVTQAVVLNPTPADEQRRLDAVAAEVQRRRALREQAAQQAGQPAAVPAPVPPAAQYTPAVPRTSPPLNAPGGARIPVPTQPVAQPR
jgi:hypothetical protein